MKKENFKEKVNKTFYDTVLKKVNEITKKYTSKLHFFFDRGEKLNLSYETGGFRPSKFYLVHNTINPLSGAKGRVYFTYRNGKWEFYDCQDSSHFRIDAMNLMGESKANAFFKDLLRSVREGMAEHSKIMIKDNQARNLRISSREVGGNYENLNQRLRLEDFNYFPY